MSAWYRHNPTPQFFNPKYAAPYVVYDVDWPSQCAWLVPGPFRYDFDGDKEQ